MRCLICKGAQMNKNVSVSYLFIHWFVLVILCFLTPPCYTSGHLLSQDYFSYKDATSGIYVNSGITWVEQIKCFIHFVNVCTFTCTFDTCSTFNISYFKMFTQVVFVYGGLSLLPKLIFNLTSCFYVLFNHTSSAVCRHCAVLCLSSGANTLGSCLAVRAVCEIWTVG